jgi:hypothetical protein
VLAGGFEDRLQDVGEVTGGSRPDGAIEAIGTRGAAP